MSKKKRIYVEKEAAPGVLVSIKEMPKELPNDEAIFVLERVRVASRNYDRQTMLLVHKTAIALGEILIKAFPDELDPARKDNRPGIR